ncbi:LPS export ABC transporter periplasmic protein LptC [Candidatus Caldatribacterium sp.]|uniref:LPS export ABC transporter periplasmic protein LptC n=1 Tax=Candidatus Caldatribacterium sp. TaxID=2282143 RepID=UPI0029969AB3|nr:LPS export ABC transporter periplasmic protein LptC [Candidatus Caldatribacterium sp.]MDW8081956.1 LPS export ABC transporter periplasmic protein LptC [Candidatus Calescibacterium sp.]
MVIRSSGVFALSLVFLVLLVWYFFVLPRPGPLEVIPEEVVQQASILLEGAEVAKITESGKEWTLQAPRIERYDGTVVLSSVSGTFLRKGVPLYEVQARIGKVFLETSTVILEGVELRRLGTGEYLAGERLTWQGKAQEFLLEEVVLFGQEFAARCRALVYNVAEGKAYLRGDVVVEWGMRKR